MLLSHVIHVKNMCKSHLFTSTLLLVSLLTYSISDTAHAQRRILGSEQLDDEDSKDKKNIEADKLKAEKLAKEKIEKEKRAKEAEKEADKKAEEAEILADKLAKEKAEKEKIAKENAEKEKIEKEKKRLEKNRDTRIADSQIKRTFRRELGDIGMSVTLFPGNITVDKHSEIHLFFTEKQKVGSTVWGNKKPLKMTQILVNIKEIENVDPKKKKKKQKKKKEALKLSKTYATHPIIGSKGTYAFHFTPLNINIHQLKITGESSKGEKVTFSINLYPDVWPTPDWDEEEKNNQKLSD